MQIDKDVLRILNESDEYTFADWFGQDLTGQTYKGSIKCVSEGLTSLKGAPAIVNGSFDCSHNPLTSLEYAPQEVSGDFKCTYCRSLKTLKGAPQEVAGYFDCQSCDSLTTLEGAPQTVGGNFCCAECRSLKTLKGAPQTVNGNFDCSYNDLTSLEGAPQKVGGDFYCSKNNQLTSLEGAPQYIGGKFKSDINNIEDIQYSKDIQYLDDFKSYIRGKYKDLIKEFFKGIVKYEKEFLTPYGFTGEFVNGFEIDEDGNLDSDSSYYVYGDDADPLAQLLYVPPTAVEGCIIDEDSTAFGCYPDDIVFDEDNDTVSFDGEEVAKVDLAEYVYNTLKGTIEIDPDEINNFMPMYDKAKSLASQGKTTEDEEVYELEKKFKEALEGAGYELEITVPGYRGTSRNIDRFEFFWNDLFNVEE